MTRIFTHQPLSSEWDQPAGNGSRHQPSSAARAARRSSSTANISAWRFESSRYNNMANTPNAMKMK
jgi:hypothetical protein